MHCVDLDESFQTHIYLQNLASIQPRTSPLKFVGSVNAGVAAVRAAEEQREAVRRIAGPILRWPEQLTHHLKSRVDELTLDDFFDKFFRQSFRKAGPSAKFEPLTTEVGGR